jgi:hypothetical protein
MSMFNINDLSAKGGMSKGTRRGKRHLRLSDLDNHFRLDSFRL